VRLRLRESGCYLLLGIVWLELARSFGGFETLSDDLMTFQGINVPFVGFRDTRYFV
jgi:hypothetical protein